AAGARDARDPFEAREDLAVEERPRRVLEVWAGFREVRLREPHGGRHDVLRIEAGVHVLKPPEAAQQQAGADQEDEREGELADDEEAPETVALAADRGAARGLPHCLREPRAGGMERRRHSEEDSRDGGEQESE